MRIFLNLLLIAIHMLVLDLHIPLNSMVKLAAFQTVIIFCLKLIRMISLTYTKFSMQVQSEQTPGLNYWAALSSFIFGLWRGMAVL